MTVLNRLLVRYNVLLWWRWLPCDLIDSRLPGWPLLRLLRLQLHLGMIRVLVYVPLVSMGPRGWRDGTTRIPCWLLTTAAGRCRGCTSMEALLLLAELPSHVCVWHLL